MTVFLLQEVKEGEGFNAPGNDEDSNKDALHRKRIHRPPLFFKGRNRYPTVRGADRE